MNIRKKSMPKQIRKRTSIHYMMLLLVAIEVQENIKQRELAVLLKTSKPSVTRLLRRAREDYAVIINCECGKGTALYKIESWGILDKKAVYRYLKDRDLLN
jgi:DNA-binding transcriptional regulator LsrR (DeoR family)